MKIFNNTTHLTGAVIATLACASLIGCSRDNDRVVVRDASVPPLATSNNTYANNETTSNTTIAANEEAAPPAMDESMPADSSSANSAASTSTTSTTTRTETRKAKHGKAKHKAKKHRKHDSAMIDHSQDQVRAPIIENNNNVYDSTRDRDVAAVDATQDYRNDNKGTESGVTSNSPVSYYENGLSPFAQEPASRIPTQIGSGQMTGEDRSTTILDGPSLFQDPSALGRNIVR